MGSFLGLLLYYFVLLSCLTGSRGDATQEPLIRGSSSRNDTLITQKLFWELEELARIVDISYCVGTAGLGIQKPFSCASRCGDRDFETFELVKVSAACRNVSRGMLIYVGMEHRALPL
jgi:hypothetical protein